MKNIFASVLLTTLIGCGGGGSADGVSTSSDTSAQSTESALAIALSQAKNAIAATSAVVVLVSQ